MADLNPFASFAQGRQLGMAKRAEDRLLEDREREAATRNRMAQLFAGGIPATPAGRGAVTAELARGGDIKGALDWSKHFEKAPPDMLARRKQEAPFLVSELQGARDQATYDRARANLAGYGVDVDDMPDVYDPSQVNMVTQAARYLAEGAPEAPAAGPFEGKSMDAQTFNILLDPNADPSSPEYRAAYQYQAQPRITFDPVTGRQITVTPDVSAFRRPTAPGATQAAAPEMVMPPATDPKPAAVPEPMGTPGAGVTVTEVAKPKLSMTEAQQMASFDQAKADIASAEEILFPKGEFDRGAAAAAYAAAPGTEGRTASQALRRTIEVLLRLRTGAAAPESEVRSYMDQFMPSPLDNNEQAQAKRRALNAFFDGTRKYFGQGRGGEADPEEAPTAPPGAASRAGMAPGQPAEPPEISSQEQYEALPAGSEYRAPDGTLRIKR